MFPDDSIQYIVGEWWIEEKPSEPTRGRLIIALLADLPSGIVMNL